ncbi:MAG TPA: class I lanthipeptide [Thermoanaerobaculia bacterium]|jgi:hypothetical protein|nr:class I lanthipeptide [Thermoanaerobaculia bacterium]
MNKTNSKKLALRVETLRNLNAREMNQVRGGQDPATICWTIVIPSSGITTTYPIYTEMC